MSGEYADHSIRKIPFEKEIIYQVRTMYPAVVVHQYEVISNRSSVRDYNISENIVSLSTVRLNSIPNDGEITVTMNGDTQDCF